MYISTIHVGEYTRPMDPSWVIGKEEFEAVQITLLKALPVLPEFKKKALWESFRRQVTKMFDQLRMINDSKFLIQENVWGLKMNLPY